MELSGKQKKNENLTIPKEKGIKVYIYIYIAEANLIKQNEIKEIRKKKNSDGKGKSWKLDSPK